MLSIEQKLGCVQIGAEGKRLRPTMLLLMASSLSAYVPSPDFLTVDDRPPNVHPSEVSTNATCFPLEWILAGMYLKLAEVWLYHFIHIGSYEDSAAVLNRC